MTNRKTCWVIDGQGGVAVGYFQLCVFDYSLKVIQCKLCFSSSLSSATRSEKLKYISSISGFWLKSFKNLHAKRIA